MKWVLVLVGQQNSELWLVLCDMDQLHRFDSLWSLTVKSDFKLVFMHDYYCILGRPFVKRFTLCYRTIVCLSVLSICDVGALWPNGWMYQIQTWHGGRPRLRPYCVRRGSGFPQKVTQPPSFRPMCIVARCLPI